VLSIYPKKGEREALGGGVGRRVVDALSIDPYVEAREA